MTRTRTDSIPVTRSFSPRTSITSCRQSVIVWRTRTWSGISSGPGATFSWQAASVGNTAAIRSSASIRWIAGGFFFPPRIRRTASEVFRFHRHRAANIGEGSTACLTTHPAAGRGWAACLVACPVGCRRVSDRGPDGAAPLRQLARPARRLAEPERHRGRRAMRVLHPDDTGLYPPDPPRGRAEQEDISHHALDRPVLVDRADERVVWLGQDPVVAELRDRTARGQRRHAGTSPALQLPVDLVPVQVAAAPAAAGRDSLGKQADDLIEFRCRHRRERP